jgi:hypothetical protein
LVHIIGSKTRVQTLTFRRSRTFLANTRYIRSKMKDNNASLRSLNGIKGLRVAMQKSRKERIVRTARTVRRVRTMRSVRPRRIKKRKREFTGRFSRRV